MYVWSFKSFNVFPQNLRQVKPKHIKKFICNNSFCIHEAGVFFFGLFLKTQYKVMNVRL